MSIAFSHLDNTLSHLIHKCLEENINTTTPAIAI